MFPKSGVPSEAMSREFPTIDVALDENQYLRDSIACRRCGYDLRGLPAEGRCPECGTAVGWSIHGDLLRYSDPAWVKHQADGALLLIIAIFASFIVAALGALIAGSRIGDAAANVLSIGVSLISLIGIWKITIPEAARAADEPPGSVRALTRVFALLGFLTAPVTMVFNQFGGAEARTPSAYELVILGGLSLADVIATLLIFTLFRRLAMRIPDERLAGQTRIVQYGVVAGYGVAIFAGLAVWVIVPGPAATPAGGFTSVLVLGVAMIAAAIALLIFGIWWIVLLLRYRFALHTAAEEAMSTWMRQSPVSSTYLDQISNAPL